MLHEDRDVGRDAVLGGELHREEPRGRLALHVAEGQQRVARGGLEFARLDGGIAPAEVVRDGLVGQQGVDDRLVVHPLHGRRIDEVEHVGIEVLRLHVDGRCVRFKRRHLEGDAIVGGLHLRGPERRRDRSRVDESVVGARRGEDRIPGILLQLVGAVGRADHAESGHGLLGGHAHGLVDDDHVAEVLLVLPAGVLTVLHLIGDIHADDIALVGIGRLNMQVAQRPVDRRIHRERDVDLRHRNGLELDLVDIRRALAVDRQAVCVDVVGHSGQQARHVLDQQVTAVERVREVLLHRDAEALGHCPDVGQVVLEILLVGGVAVEVILLDEHAQVGLLLVAGNHRILRARLRDELHADIEDGRNRPRRLHDAQHGRLRIARIADGELRGARLGELVGGNREGDHAGERGGDSGDPLGYVADRNAALVDRTGEPVRHADLTAVGRNGHLRGIERKGRGLELPLLLPAACRQEQARRYESKIQLFHLHLSVRIKMRESGE